MTDRAMRDTTKLSALRGGLTVHSVAAMLLLAVIWGLSIPATKLGLLTLPPLTLTALRFLVAVPLLMIFALGRLRVPWRAVPGVLRDPAPTVPDHWGASVRGGNAEQNRRFPGGVDATG